MKRLQEKLENQTLILSDPISIKYFTGYDNQPGERLMALVIEKDAITFVLNAMFPKPETYNAVYYQDSDNPISILENCINHDTILVDGNLPSRFLIGLINENRTFQNGSHLIESIRNIKSKSEIETMKKASLHNDRIMSELIGEIHEGMREIDLANIIKEKQSTKPLTGVSFEPIAVFTENIANPHAIPSERTLKKGDAILIDMGGIYQDYHSDMTRTLFYGENKVIEKLYDIVLEANLKAIAAIEVGQPLSNVDKAARDVIESHGYGEHFTHRTGHGIGLETHENLDVSSSNQTLIQNGMCFSIEPGIYIEGVGGVRIEDLVTIENGKATVLNHFTKSKLNLLK